MSAKIGENIMCVQKNYIWNFSTCICENRKYLGFIVGNSVITCDEIIEVTVPTKSIPTKTTATNFNIKKVNCKTENFYVLLTFLSITITLFIAVSIYCYLIVY